MRAAILLLALAAAGCDQEKRLFVKPVTQPHPITIAESVAELQPGQAGPGMKMTGKAGGYDETNAYEVSQGKQWFRWYNCVGCHAQGGGAIGPALMDDQWIYGSKPDEIFATIMLGRPNGMPAFRGRIPEGQAWQLVAYVRSMSGLVATAAAPNRSERLLGPVPENRRDPERPGEKSRK
jgi:cytochrome c oxidase cbb3-type subunit 3